MADEVVVANEIDFAASFAAEAVEQSKDKMQKTKAQANKQRRGILNKATGIAVINENTL
jgi:hypothetical protein